MPEDLTREQPEPKTPDAPPTALGARKVLLLAAIHAALFFLAFHPVALFPLAWVAFAPFALIVARGSRGESLWGGFVAAAAGGGASVHWLTLFGPEPWAGTAFGFGLYGLFMAALGRPLSRRLPAVVWLPLTVVTQEALRGHLFFWAFPWVYLAHSQVFLDPLLQSADLGGAPLISLVVAAFSGAVADRLLGASWRRTLLEGAAVLLVALGLSGYGLARARSLAPSVDRSGPLVMAVQGNIPQYLKNAQQRRPDLMRTHYNLTMDAAKARKDAHEPPVDLVAWPETMVPIEWNHKRGDWPYDMRLTYASVAVSPVLREWFTDMGRFTQAKMLVGSIHCDVVTGTAHATEGGWEAVETNSAFLLGPDGKVLGRYDKMFPAPMSEYTPFYEEWPALYRFLRETFVPPGFSQFHPGKDIPLWQVGEFEIAASVCFDITFPRSTNQAAREGADAIVNISNYGWFMDSAQLDLARAQTIFRAIETRKGVVAVCNGGITSFVDPLGVSEDIEAPNAQGVLSKKLVAGTMVRRLTTWHGTTLYVAWGEWSAWGTVGLTVLLLIVVTALRMRDDARRRARTEEPKP